MSDTPEPITTPSAAAVRLAERLNEIIEIHGPNALPVFDQAARLGVELVDRPSAREERWHCAEGGSAVHVDGRWIAVAHDGPGIRVQSGDMHRIHQPGIHPDAVIHRTAIIHPTARVEAGAVIGADVVVEAHAHVGNGSTIDRDVYVGAGAFVGPRSTIGAHTHLGDGAVVGAGAALDRWTLVSTGARVDQAARTDSYQTVGRTTPGARPQHGRNAAWTVSTIANSVERIIGINHE